MAADFQNILKAVPTAGIWFIGHKGEVNKEHALVLTESGSVVYLNPQQGVAHLVHNGISTNAAFVVTYSHVSQCIYLFTIAGVLIEFDVNSFETKYYSYHDNIMPSSNAFLSTVPMGQSSVLSVGVLGPHYVLPSQDGNIHFAGIRSRSIPSHTVFDVTTKTFSSIKEADNDYEHLSGKPGCEAFNLDGTAGALAGTYSEYIFADDKSELFTTIQSEITAAGLTYNDTNNASIRVHYDDRALVSATRRIYAPINGTWKVIDVKSPSTFLNSTKTTVLNALTAWQQAVGAWVDESATPVSDAGWSTGILSDYEAVTVPSNFSFFYSRVRQVGRYTYEWGDYCNNKVYYYHYAYHPTTGEALYPDTFDKLTTWQNNGVDPKVYKCNFGGVQGFSSDDELVVAVRNNAGNTGYYRPDTHTWTAYDFVADPSGYVIREVDVNDVDDPDWIGVYIHPTQTTQNVSFLGQTWTASTGGPSWMTSAVNPILAQTIDPDRTVADLTIEMTPDYLGETIYTKTVEGISTLMGIVNSAFDAGSNRYIFLGGFYSGIAAGTLTPPYTQDAYFGDVTSIYGGNVLGNKLVGWGYLNNIQIVDFNSWPPTKSELAIGGQVNQQEAAFVRTSEIVFAGIMVRTANYRNNYFRVGYTDLTTAFGFPNLPNEINPQVAITWRTDLGLTQEEYTDAEVNTAVENYVTANPPTTRTDVINSILDSAKWKALWVTGYGNKVIFAAQRLGIAALAGIRVNSQSDGLGTWYDENYLKSTDYPSAFYIDIADLSTATTGDYKKVQFQVAGLQGVDSIGRVFVTDSHIAFVNNEAGSTVIRIISKANFESAATGSGIVTAFDFITTIPNTTAGSVTSYTTQSDRYRNMAFSTNNHLYLACSSTNTSGGNKIIGYRVLLTDGTYTEFLTNATSVDNVITITRNAANDRVLVAKNKEVWKIDSFTSETLPIIIS